jgi:hypothetical protein
MFKHPKGCSESSGRFSALTPLSLRVYPQVNWQFHHVQYPKVGQDQTKGRGRSYSLSHGT